MNALPTPRRSTVLGPLVDGLASLGLSCTLLLLLLFITWRGTMAQVDLGLFEAQKKYFDSLYFVEMAGPIPILFPGAYLVLAALTVNLVLGGILRLRKGVATLGVLITHLGIVLMIVAGLVKFHYSVDGAMRLDPDRHVSSFTSYHDWELAIAKVDGADPQRVWLVPGAEFMTMSGAQTRTFRHPELPFAVSMSGFTRNAFIRQHVAGNPRGARVVDGFFVDPMPLELENEFNEAACYVDVVRGADGARSEGILWGANRAPFVVRDEDRTWTIDLRRKRYELPFSVRLDRFVKDDHPGVSMARDFRSFVTRTENDLEQGVEISMNEPMRHGGYIFYQSNWGPQRDAPPGTPLYSILTVVSNPSDQWPLISCLIIAVGMSLHFGRKLWLFAQRAGASS
ncbi:MAG: cytochrome c biogenesis protein ResB [Planctomycetes bacterium]|nr:cytochrome c biogenesis protein ResB [Planctomycetota bacterium]